MLNVLKVVGLMTAVEEHVELWNTRQRKRGFIISTFVFNMCIIQEYIYPRHFFTLLNLLAVTVRRGLARPAGRMDLIINIQKVQ